MQARDYQITAQEMVFRKWQTRSSTLVVMPTGTGKTVLFSLAIKRALKEFGGRAMVIAHREELVRQAADKLEACGVATEIEMAEERADGSFLRRADCVVASIQTLTRRGKRFQPGEFSVAVLDEAHHYTSPSWRAYIEHLQQNEHIKILGVTATPDRADKVGLGAVFQSVAFEYEIADAINDGYLVRPVQQFIHIEGMDFSNVRTTAGDLNGRDLADVMDAERVLHPIALATVEQAGAKKTIVFAPPGFRESGGESFRVSERLCEMINRYRPGTAALISDSTPKDSRRQILSEFAARRIQFLVNVGVLTEGFDAPDIELVVLARPTKSRALYAQMVGRGTRPLPGVVDGLTTPTARRDAIAASLKPVVTVLDFVGVTGKHKLISACDILGGKEPPEIVEAAKDIIAKRGPMPVESAIEEAKAEAERRREAKAAEEARRAKVKAKVQYKMSSVNPFDVLDVTRDRQINTVTSEPATARQRELLEKFGIQVEDVTLREAKRLIATCIERRNAGLCSYKQAALLRKFNHPEPEKLSFSEASQLIGEYLNKKRSQRTANEIVVPPVPELEEAVA